MPAARSDLHELVEHLPDAEIPVALRFLQFLAQEPIGPAFSESIRRGMTQADTGQTVLCRKYDEMVAKLLGKEFPTS